MTTTTAPADTRNGSETGPRAAMADHGLEQAAESALFRRPDPTHLAAVSRDGPVGVCPRLLP